jgi:hypothetical protein
VVAVVRWEEEMGNSFAGVTADCQCAGSGWGFINRRRVANRIRQHTDEGEDPLRFDSVDWTGRASLLRGAVRGSAWTFPVVPWSLEKIL